jgi:pantothenate kinase
MAAHETHRLTAMPNIPASHLQRIGTLLEKQQRVMLGLVGAPGAGKSTLAQSLGQAFASIAQVVPMDGFHLANIELQRLGRAGRKGAPDTFDSAGYAALLRRIRDQRGDGHEIVYAPEFRREIEEPIAGAIAVLPSTRLVITEGNYLLLECGTCRWTMICAAAASCSATNSSAAAPKPRSPGWKAPTSRTRT